MALQLHIHKINLKKKNEKYTIDGSGSYLVCGYSGDLQPIICDETRHIHTKINWLDQSTSSLQLWSVEQ